MKRITLTLIGLLLLTMSYGQDSVVSISKIDFRIAEENKENTIVNERPFNFFVSAGIEIRGLFKDRYNVAISPKDNTVHFEKIGVIISSVSTGLVWNPFRNYNKVTYKDKDGKNKTYYESKRCWIAVALLVGIDVLNKKEKGDTATLIDVGFGVGYRKGNFLILLTGEFTPIRQPRQYFIDQYKGKNCPLILANSEEPVRTINSNDNSLFISKIIPSFGLKIGFSFEKKK